MTVEDEVDVPIYHDGYLFCGNEANSDLLYNNHKIQLSQKAQVQLLDTEELKAKFKWINGEDLKLASFGYNNEGWLDSRKFLLAVRKKALHIGADYVEGENFSRLYLGLYCGWFGLVRPSLQILFMSVGVCSI